MTILSELFKKNRAVGLVGNCGEGKSSLAIDELIKLKEEFKVPIYVLGVEQELYPMLEKNCIHILSSKDDVLDLKISGSVIYIDEFAQLFSTQTRDKELEKLKRFFNRIDHLNDFILISTAQTGFWNKFMNSLIRAFLVKKVELDDLVNGTILKRKVMAITENTNEYRLDIPKDTFYVVTDDDVVKKKTFKYNKEFDSKIENTNPFLEKSEGKREKNNK
jgi:hypothetical protein